MYHLLGHAKSYLVRRNGQDITTVFQEIPNWGYSVLGFTYLACIVGVFLVVYTLVLIYTLACVEAPRHAFAASKEQSGRVGPAYEEKDALTGEEAAAFLNGGASVDEERPQLFDVHQRPITASIRQSVRHLKLIGGSPGLWRGFAFNFIWILCSLTVSVTVSVLLDDLYRPVGILTPFASSILTRILFCTWEMKWTHIVISSPSSKYWYQRLPKLNTWKKIWLPTAIAEGASQFAAIIVTVLGLAFQLYDVKQVERQSLAVIAVKIIALLLIYLVLWVLLIIPTDVALKRVQCSLLAEDEETIVPIDRTFGNRVVSESTGGSGKLSYRDAWKSIDREASWRIVKVILKSLLIYLGVVLIFAVIFAIEGALIVAPAFRRSHFGLQFASPKTKVWPSADSDGGFWFDPQDLKKGDYSWSWT